MEHLWIALAVTGAALQTVRTAAQRDLNRHLSTLTTTYVRSLFGLPFLAVYLLAVLWLTGEGVPRFSAAYLLITLAGAMAQVVATFLLILTFRLKNFGVGTMLTKGDIVMTAVLGALLFSETLTAGGTVALLVVMAGVVLMSIDRTIKAVPGGAAGLPGPTGAGAVIALLTDRSVQVALACALAFSLSYLAFREAALVIGDGSFLWRGAWTVVLAIAMQTVLVGAWIAWREPQVLGQLWPHRKLSTFIGATSAVGSICWFTAFAMQNASYVRAVGQIEVVFTLLASALYYHERISAKEYVGIALTVLGVLLFRLLY